MERTQLRQDILQIHEPDEAEITGWSEREYQAFMMGRMRQIIRTSPTVGRRLAASFADNYSETVTCEVFLITKDGKNIVFDKLITERGFPSFILTIFNNDFDPNRPRLDLEINPRTVVVCEDYFGNESDLMDGLCQADLCTQYTSGGRGKAEGHSVKTGPKSEVDMRMVSLQMLRDFQTALDEDEKAVQEAKTAAPNQVCV